MGRKVRNTAPLGIVLDAGSAVPLQRQIGAQLRAAILERRLPPGAPLPSSRVMAAEFSCARGTVSSAIDQLIAEGYVVSRAASGIAVAPDLPDDLLFPPAEIPAPRATQPLPEPAAMLAFPLGQPDRHAFPFPLWAKLLEREWRRPGWHIAGTPHPFGHPELQRAIAAYLGAARGFACAPAAIVITSGIRQSVALFARTVLAANESAFIEDPGYPGMAEGLEAAGMRPIASPIDHAGFSIEAAAALSPETRLAIVAPSHQFPLGVVLTLQRRLELLGWAERTGGWIAEDDFDGEYRYAGRPLAPLRALDRNHRVAYLGSFSKILFPALRLSYLVLPGGLVDAAHRVMGSMGPGASLLGQGALARFIADGHLAIHLRRTRLLYAARQQALLHAAQMHLAGLQLTPDSGGMQLIASPAPGLRFDDVAVAAAAGERGVRVAALSSLYRNAPRAQGLILGYAATPEADMAPALQQLNEAVRLSSQLPPHGRCGMGFVKRGMPNPPPLRVAIAGFGAIGKSVARHVLAGIPGLTLSAVGVRDPVAARKLLPMGVVLTDLGSLADHADIVVECAPSALLPTIAEPALRGGRTLVVLSCGALLERMDLVDLARAHGGRIMVPTGALLALDAVNAAAEGTIQSVRMTTRKPPNGLAGAPHLVRHGISVEGLAEPLLVFEGTAREAARGFPANVNVAAALSLAGIGADRTRVAIWADPSVTRNVHQIEVDADSARFTMQIENVPSENPKTGRITALSVVALLRRLRAPLVIGS